MEKVEYSYNWSLGVGLGKSDFQLERGWGERSAAQVKKFSLNGDFQRKVEVVHNPQDNMEPLVTRGLISINTKTSMELESTL